MNKIYRIEIVKYAKDYGAGLSVSKDGGHHWSPLGVQPYPTHRAAQRAARQVEVALEDAGLEVRVEEKV